jgi:hypothetical protein
MGKRDVLAVEVVTCLKRLAVAARWAERLLRRIGVEPRDGEEKAEAAKGTRHD